MTGNTRDRHTVRTQFGDVTGVGAPGQMSSFLGIPFAKDPVGQRRFRAPQAPAPWTSPRDAIVPGPGAPQLPSRLEAVMGQAHGSNSEAGCLTLNVWTPDPNGRFPVLFWLHGGGWATGSSAWNWYRGCRLAADHQIVVVTANYRLGPLGYLYLGEQDGMTSDAANFGLLDQIAALQWVADNVANFGGDPGHITVGGQSAGAHAAAHLAAHPRTKRLVRRLFLQSAPLSTPNRPPSEAGEITAEFVSLLESTQDGRPDLSTVSAQDLNQANALLAQRMPARSIGAPLINVVRNDDAPWENTRQCLLSGVSADVDVMIGATKHEAQAFLMGTPAVTLSESAAAAVAAIWGPRATDVFARHRAAFEDARPWQALAAALTSHEFTNPMLEIARERSRSHLPTYVYEFGYGPAPVGACHCIDLPFLFNNLELWNGASMLFGLDQERASTLAYSFSASVANFVKTGNPKMISAPTWRPFADGEVVMQFGDGADASLNTYHAR